MPILIAAGEGEKTVIRGLATEISRNGMTFYAGVHLEEGDQMEVEFQTAHHVRLKGVVRNRNGYCFGLEFLAQLSNTDAAPVTAPAQRTPWYNWMKSQPAADPEKGKKPASYQSICAELAQAEDKLAARLQRRLESSTSSNGDEIKRLCANLLRIRELRRQMEQLSRQK